MHLYKIIWEIMDTSTPFLSSLHKHFRDKKVKLSLKEDHRFPGCTFCLVVEGEGGNEMLIPFVWEKPYTPSIPEAFRNIKTLNQGH